MMRVLSFLFFILISIVSISTSSVYLKDFADHYGIGHSCESLNIIDSVEIEHHHDDEDDHNHFSGNCSSLAHSVQISFTLQELFHFKSQVSISLLFNTFSRTLLSDSDAFLLRIIKPPIS